MKLQMFTVYDKAVQAYLPPFYARAKGEAVRSFAEACNDEKSNFNKHAIDYVLMFLGEFDDSSGIFASTEPVRIISALELLVDNPFSPESENRGPLKDTAHKRLPM